MSQAYYDLYKTAVKALARTLVMKSNDTASAVNTYVTDILGGTVDGDSPASWKYYLNMGGIYHDTDTVMTVKSLDTEQTITFTSANLQIHLATAKAYSYGSQYYVDLLQEYPLQEALIRGIINPVNIPMAVAAVDHTILWYDATLVESNETNLIPRLQNWINGVMFRYHVPDYALVDAMYVPTQLAMMYAFIPAAIMNIRKDNCKTRFASSYHVQEYLASNSALDKYVPFLTLTQRLWLYRNIRYLQRNQGQQQTFDWLVENIMTPQSMPLASFEMRHNVKNMPLSITPDVEYVRTPLNLGYSLAGNDVRTTKDILIASEGVARSNSDLVTIETAAIDEIMTYSPMDILKTKVLESNVTDLTDAAPYTLSDVLMNHWLYLAYTGQYASFVEITNPATLDTYTLSVKDAFILFFYTYLAQYGIKQDVIPAFQATCVLKSQLPTLAEMKAKVDPYFVASSYLEQALEATPELKVYISVQAFYNEMVVLHSALLTQWTIYTQMVTYQGRAQAENAVMSLYEDTMVPLTTDTDYEKWLSDRTIDLSTLNRSQFTDLASAIYESATGVNLSTAATLSDIQQALVGIMKRMSSYTVQFNTVINDSSILVADWAAPRLGMIHRHEDRSVFLHAAMPALSELGYRLHFEKDINVTENLTFTMVTTLKFTGALNIDLDCMYAKKITYAAKVQQPRVVLSLNPRTSVDLSTGDYNGTLQGYSYVDLPGVSQQDLESHDTTYTNVANDLTNEFPLPNS